MKRRNGSERWARVFQTPVFARLHDLPRRFLFRPPSVCPLATHAHRTHTITVASTWTFEDFKSSFGDDTVLSSISDINLQLVFKDLIDRAKEKEEKEVKKRKRLAKDFTEKLSTIKELNVLSSWEECKPLIEESSEYSL
ncbi:pre-mRNA-processing protein 40A-like isoform X2 [Salvia miltiorrhiza]|uniref:pre-mRNA-processing protein 40A-like isoform X2 n=1 Tax=Salvia miltiorrhiza TaxID=226208 RepID=UPI0025AC9DEB|nr:pre-mRNA-processing protein 40A-like isoform X2 [Salvia miltiorrhiza]